MSHKMGPPEFKPPKDPALRTLWEIRNMTRLPKGNMQSYEDIVRRVSALSAAEFDRLYTITIDEDFQQ